MYVRSRMTANPYTVAPETTALETLDLMKNKKIKRVPVVKNGKLVGIVTERKIMESAPSPVTSLNMFDVKTFLSKLKIESVMTKNVITVSTGSLLEEAALKMIDNDIGALPVLDNEKLVGIITETDIFHAFIEIMGFRDFGSRIAVEIEEDKPGVLAHVSSIIAGVGLNITHLAVFRNELIIRLNTINLRDVTEALRKNGYKVISISKNE